MCVAAGKSVPAGRRRRSVWLNNVYVSVLERFLHYGKNLSGCFMAVYLV